jgi:hypothetical protein
MKELCPIDSGALFLLSFNPRNSNMMYSSTHENSSPAFPVTGWTYFNDTAKETQYGT